jgi:cytochrome c-type biogenesis protein
MEFYTFSFVQGVLAFLAPCAVALLPGYIVAFISRTADINPGLSTRLFRGLKLAMLSIAGILAIYAIAALLIVSAAQLLKDYMMWITIGMGGILIVIGILMAAGKSFSFTLNVNHATPKSEVAEAFVFGLAYAIGALGCLFPLFLIVATQALAAPSALTGAGYFAAYFAGMSLMMIATILLSVLARDAMMKYLRKILPHMEMATGWMLIFAGGYVIYYQSFLMY